MVNSINTLKHVIPDQGNNLVVFAELNDFKVSLAGKDALGIKYVLKGRERFWLGKNSYRLQAGDFLLVNRMQDFSAEIPRTEKATTLCVNIDYHLVNDVFNCLTTNAGGLLDGFGHHKESFTGVFENIYSFENNLLGKKLCAITNSLAGNNKIEFDPQTIYYEFAVDVLASDSFVKKKIKTLDFKKLSTREEIYKRIRLSKQLIDDCFLENLDLDTMAAAARLSRFHYLRIFKFLFGLTPYQYQINKKLDYAKSLLSGNGNLSINEIAYLCAFADIQSFSKAFKKSFKVSPTQFRAKVI